MSISAWWAHPRFEADQSISAEAQDRTVEGVKPGRFATALE